MDKSLPYYDIIMRSTYTNYATPKLAKGFHFKHYEDGDEKHWCALEYEVGEFVSEEAAMEYFTRVFLPYKELLSDRMFFIIDDNHQYLATASAWFKDDEHKHYPLLHWVSCSSKVRGKGLGKSIVAYALSQFKKVEPNYSEIYLHTQTWSYKAIALYYQYGFRITQLPLLTQTTDMRCVAILKTVLNSTICDDLYE